MGPVARGLRGRAKISLQPQRQPDDQARYPFLIRNRPNFRGIMLQPGPHDGAVGAGDLPVHIG